MDYAASHVVYVDTRASRDLDGKFIPNPSPEPLGTANVRREGASKDRSSDFLLREIEDVRTNVRTILSVFDGGMYYLSLRQKSLLLCVLG